MLLAGRVRKQEEEAIILAILEKHFKRKINTEELFSQQHVISQFSKCFFYCFNGVICFLYSEKGWMGGWTGPIVNGFALML